MRLPVVFAILTAICWGLYGPVLAKSRGFLDQSPFKPYVAIGLAYLLWGVLGGVVGMYWKKDSFSFTGLGALWGLAAGTLGAWGALTLTLAMFNGGKPYIVMPIVFGGAVTVSALYSIWTESSEVTISPFLWIGIAGIVVCAILVASNAPHPKPASAKPTASTTMPEPRKVEA